MQRPGHRRRAVAGLGSSGRPVLIETLVGSRPASAVRCSRAAGRDVRLYAGTARPRRCCRRRCGAARARSARGRAPRERTSLRRLVADAVRAGAGDLLGDPGFGIRVPTTEHISPAPFGDVREHEEVIGMTSWSYHSDMRPGQPDAGVVDDQHRSMSLCREGRPDRIGSLFDDACPTAVNARIPGWPNAYFWTTRGALGCPFGRCEPPQSNGARVALKSARRRSG